MKRSVDILLVEDDIIDRIDLQRKLDKKGILYRIKIAKNGQEAMALLKETESPIYVGKPDVIFLDINMPTMSGLEFLQRIREEDAFRDVRIYILTTSEEGEDRSAAASFGVSGFIAKPLKLEYLTFLDCI